MKLKEKFSDKELELFELCCKHKLLGVDENGWVEVFSSTPIDEVVETLYKYVKQIKKKKNEK